MFRWRERRGTHIVADGNADPGAHRDANATWRCDCRAGTDADCDRIAHTDADATAVGARDREYRAAAAQ